MPKPQRGGRTAVHRLPNHTNATFPKNKFKNYLLNPSKDANKSQVFKSIGYNMKNTNRLIADITDGLKKNKATMYAQNKYGTPAQVEMVLGITKQQKMVTAWIFPKGSNTPRFVTAYPAKEAK